MLLFLLVNDFKLTGAFTRIGQFLCKCFHVFATFRFSESEKTNQSSVEPSNRLTDSLTSSPPATNTFSDDFSSSSRIVDPHPFLCSAFPSKNVASLSIGSSHCLWIDGGGPFCVVHRSMSAMLASWPLSSPYLCGLMRKLVVLYWIYCGSFAGDFYYRCRWGRWRCSLNWDLLESGRKVVFIRVVRNFTKFLSV